MGDIINSLFSGFIKVIGDLFGSPLDFLSGKSCSSVCGPTWDFVCYIENFCVANLVKMAIVLALSYFVLLFFYLLYKLGICWCIGHSLCKMLWACLVSWFSLWEYCCTFFLVKLIRLKRKRRRHQRRMYFEEEMDASDGDEYYDEGFSYDLPRSNSLSHRSTDYRGAHLRKSLRPRSHRVQVGISRRDLVHGHKRNSMKHHHNHVSKFRDNIRVTHTSKFAKKGRNSRGVVYRSRKW